VAGTPTVKTAKSHYPVDFTDGQESWSAFVAETAKVYSINYEQTGTNIDPHHPHNALERNFAEQFCHNYMRRVLPDRHLVQNVYGKSNREKALSRLVTRARTWTNQPVLHLSSDQTVEQLFRNNESRPGLWCDHDPQECDCRVFDYAFAPDTLYYMNPVHWACVVANTNTRSGLAYFHIGQPDHTTEYINKDGAITVQYRGNSARYHYHDMQFWDRTNHMAYPDLGIVLIWSLLVTHGSMRVFKYRAVPIELFPNFSYESIETVAQFYEEYGLSPDKPVPTTPTVKVPGAEVPNYDNAVADLAAQFMWAPHVGTNVMRTNASTARQVCHQYNIRDAKVINRILLAALEQAKEVQEDTVSVLNQRVSRWSFTKRWFIRIYNFFCSILALFTCCLSDYSVDYQPEDEVAEYLQGNAAAFNRLLKGRDQLSNSTRTYNVTVTLILALLILALVLLPLTVGYRLLSQTHELALRPARYVFLGGLINDITNQYNHWKQRFLEPPLGHTDWSSPTAHHTTVNPAPVMNIVPLSLDNCVKRLHPKPGNPSEMLSPLTDTRFFRTMLMKEYRSSTGTNLEVYSHLRELETIFLLKTPKCSVILTEVIKLEKLLLKQNSLTSSNPMKFAALVELRTALMYILDLLSTVFQNHCLDAGTPSSGVCTRQDAPPWIYLIGPTHNVSGSESVLKTVLKSSETKADRTLTSTNTPSNGKEKCYPGSECQITSSTSSKSASPSPDTPRSPTLATSGLPEETLATQIPVLVIQQ
jgi:hypothetical protein